MTIKDRLAVCRQCEHLIVNQVPPPFTLKIERCEKCGCPIVHRAVINSCPAGKFPQ